MTKIRKVVMDSLIKLTMKMGSNAADHSEFIVQRRPIRGVRAQQSRNVRARSRVKSLKWKLRCQDKHTLLICLRSVAVDLIVTWNQKILFFANNP